MVSARHAHLKMTKENLEKIIEKLPSFDPSSSPYSPQNREAAKAHDVKYNARKGYYTDSDGCLMRDRFGQPL